MANSILGNNGPAEHWMTEWEVEIDDDEYEDMEGEIVDEMDVFGYRAITPKASQTTSVKIFFYYKAPTSEWYWDYMYGDPYRPIIPLVFTCDANWKLTQILNGSLYEVALANRSDGWIEMNVSLQRKLVQGERIFFGVYSDTLGVISTHVDDPTDSCYLYFSSARRSSYNSQIAYVSSSEWLTKASSLPWDNDICCYLQYENEIESVAYTRTVLGNVGAAAANSRKTAWKRTLVPAGNITSLLNRKADSKRNLSSSGAVASVCGRSNLMRRNGSSGFSVADANNNRISFFRSLENTGAFTASNNRALRMKIEKSDEFTSLDALQHFLFMLRSCYSGGGLSEGLNHKADYKRLSESSFGNLEEVSRKGDCFRGAADSVDFMDVPFASRLFFRTVQTAMSFWDWLRGKIREANNVVTLFCPVDFEIELECII